MIGKTISHYKILEKLGEGGMGEVYLAEDNNLKRKVALKFFPKKYSRDPESKKRFISEARSASNLDHNNICVIHEISETDDGQLFISMNYCRGETLQNHIREKDLTVKEILKIITQIAKGLEKAHSKGIIHCDIKPSNIMITNDRVAKIVDFGIAKIASEEKLHSKERTSGTIAYMSPEQVGNSGIDARTDIWSLGVVFYEMLTKRVPFQDSYNEALMYSIINEEPEQITTIKPDIPTQLEQIVNKLLKKNPDERYCSVNELLADIKSYGRIVDIPINPIKYFKLFFADKKNKRLSLVTSFLLSIFVFSIIYFTVIRGSSVPSIGILNMENLGNPEDEFWSRGITKDLIINVASAGIIRVPTFSEVNKYMGSDFSLEDIAKKLRVDYLLISSFTKSDSMFDLWCRIIDPKSGKDIFAKKWTKPVKNASTITTLLAGIILNNLGISTDKILTIPVIIDPDAYELYLKGKHAWETKQNNDDIILSRGLLRQAIDIDQNFILAKIQLGQSYTGTVDYDQALALFKECLDYGKEFNDENAVALAMYNIGNIHLYKYQFEGATDNYKKALKIVRTHNDKHTESKLLRNIGSSHYMQNNYKKAEEYYNESRLISAMLDDKLGEAESLFNLGSIFLETMEFKAAMTSYKELYDIFDSINNKSQMVNSLIGLSYSSVGLGKIESALNYAEESLQSAKEISDKRNAISSLSLIGEINYSIGDYDTALDVFITVSQMADDIDETYYLGVSNQYLGQIMHHKKLYQESFKYYELANSIWTKLDDPTHGIWTTSAWAYTFLIYGDLDRASKMIKEAEYILIDVQPYKYYATYVYYNLYNYYETTGDTSLAKQYLSLANNEMNDRIKFIQNYKDKRNYINKIVVYDEISNKYKKYFN